MLPSPLPGIKRFLPSLVEPFASEGKSFSKEGPMIGARAGAAVRLRDQDGRDHHTQQAQEIPELRSSGSSSSDDEHHTHRAQQQQQQQQQARRRSSVAQGAIPLTIEEVHQARRESVSHASAMLYMSPARNQYHMKILDRMGLKAIADESLADRNSADGRESLMEGSTGSGENSGGGALKRKGSLFLLPSKSYVLQPFAYPQNFVEGGVTWRDRLYGLVTNYEDLGIQYQMDAKWRKANVAVVRITSLVVVISIVSLCFETVPKFQSSAYPFFLIVEAVCVAWLFADFLVRMICTREDMLTFWLDPMTAIDFLSMIPIFLDLAVEGPDVSGLAVIRVVRLVRTIRLVRNSRTQGILELTRAMRKSVSALSLLFFLLVITMFVSSSIIYLLDIQHASFDEVQNLWIRNDGTISPFQSIFHCMWFCLTTLTTVGYGDDFPFAPAAKASSAALMVTGVLVIAFPTVILSASFHQAYSERFLTMLRNNLTDKQRESLAFGRNRKSIAALALRGGKGFSFRGGGSDAAGDTGGGPQAKTDGNRSSFKSRLINIMRRTSEEDTSASAAPQPTAAAPANRPEPTATAPQDEGAPPKKTSGSRWTVLKKIASGSDLSTKPPEATTEGDHPLPPVSEGTAKRSGSLRRPIVSLATSDDAPLGGAKHATKESNDNVPLLSPALLTPTSPSTGRKSVQTIQDLEKRFSIPELGRMKIALIPFPEVRARRSGSNLVDGVQPDVGGGRSSESDSEDMDDTRGVVCASKCFSNRRQSTMATQVMTKRGLKLAERKANATASLGRDGVALCHSSTDSDTSIASTSSSDEHEENVHAEHLTNPLATGHGVVTSNTLSRDSVSGIVRRSRAPTIVMAKKSLTRERPVKAETSIFHKIDASIEALNYNMQQLKSQMISAGGDVSYPPKLKLLCVGGTSTISMKVEQCFPPGSHLVSLTVVLDDPEYNRVQTLLASLSFGGDRVRRVELAQIHKLRVDIRVGNVRMFVAAKRDAQGKPPLTKADMEDDTALLHELIADGDRELLNSCYLATTTYRNVIASTVDVVIMCPTTAAFKVFQRYLYMLKFTFEIQFLKPQFGKVAMRPQHTQNISIAGNPAVVERLCRKIVVTTDEKAGSTSPPQRPSKSPTTPPLTTNERAPLQHPGMIASVAVTVHDIGDLPSPEADPLVSTVVPLRHPVPEEDATQTQVGQPLFSRRAPLDPIGGRAASNPKDTPPGDQVVEFTRHPSNQSLLGRQPRAPRSGLDSAPSPLAGGAISVDSFNLNQ